MLHEHQRTVAPNLTKVSIKQAVWMVMCSEPMILAPFRGLVSPYFLRKAIRPGISCSETSISFLPHAARLMIGSDYRFLLPASALLGMAVVIFSDTFARIAVAPIVLPVGAITSALGAPLFLWIVFKGGIRRK